MFRDICLMQGYEDLHVFLLKNIYHQLGSDTLHLITNNDTCCWIIPEDVMEKIEVLFVYIIHSLIKLTISS